MDFLDFILCCLFGFKNGAEKAEGKTIYMLFSFYISLSMYLYEISILALHTMLAQLFKSNALAMAAAFFPVAAGEKFFQLFPFQK